MSGSVRSVVFGVAFVVAAIAGAAQVWGRDRSYYDAFAAAAHLERTTFHQHPVGELRADLGGLMRVDDETRRYVVEGGEVTEAMRGFFDDAELSHLADVRRVFGGVAIAGVVAGGVALLALRGLERRRARRALFVGAGAALLCGVVAAFAFEPLFLAFHAVFFPQGNFLFDPATENLVLVYPEEYWLGVTLRLGATVILACLSVGALVGLPIGSGLAVRLKKERVE